MSKVRLGDYVRIKTGKLDANAASPDGDYPFFTCAVEPLKIDSYSYDCECVLVAGNGDLNVKYYDGKFDAYQRTYIIESKDNTRLSVPYLYRFLDAYIDTLRNQSIGGVIKYIKLGNLTEARINVPAISEQNKTVKILSFVDELLKKANLQLQKLDELIKSRFVEMFDNTQYPFVKAKEVCYYITKGTTPDANELFSEYAKDRVPFLKVYNLSFTGEVLFDQAPQFVSLDTHNDKLSRSKVYPNDVLMNIVGPPLGKFTLVTNDYPEWNINQAIAIFRAKENVNAYYLMQALMQPNVLRPFLNNAVGIRQLNLSLEQCRNLEIPLPPMNLQNQFADFVTKVERQKATVQKSIDKLETLKKSLMQEYFG